MSILTGPHDQNLGKIGPPFCYTLNFGDAGDDKVEEGKRGQKWTTQELDCEFQQHSLTRERGEETGSPALPQKATHNMGDGRATVHRDTLVSIGNRCHNTFHLHLHTGREKVEMKVFWSSVMMVEVGGGEEVKTESLFFQLQDKEN